MVPQRLSILLSTTTTAARLFTRSPSYFVFPNTISFRRTRTSMSIVGSAGTTKTNADLRRAQGEFVRGASTARNWIRRSSSSSYSENGGDVDDVITYKPSMGRYHLYVVHNCPCTCINVVETSTFLQRPLTFFFLFFAFHFLVQGVIVSCWHVRCWGWKRPSPSTCCFQTGRRPSWSQSMEVCSRGNANDTWQTDHFPRMYDGYRQWRQDLCQGDLRTVGLGRSEVGPHPV